MTLTLRHAARSDVGLIREGNEDSGYAGQRLVAVADGMGGPAAGEVASAVAIGALVGLDDDEPGGDLLDRLARATLGANSDLARMVADDAGLEGMGTTLTALLLAGTRLAVVHVGDSRAYLLRAGELVQITHDHSLVQSLLDAGRLTEEEAGQHPQRSLITKALDGRSGLDPDLQVRQARAGDRYLLCSDGLSGVVSAETMRTTLLEGDPAAAVERLVDLALRGGGPDNITCIVADVVDSNSGLGTPTPMVVGAAAAEGRPSSGPDAGTSAGRAALASRAARPATDAPAAAEAPRRSGRHRARTVGRGVLVTLVVLAVLGGLGAGAYAYVRSQYYVSLDDSGDVAVFRGINGSVAGRPLSTVEAVSDLPVDSLEPAVRARVAEGITADDRADADKIVERLLDRARPTPVPCPTPTTAPTLVPTPTAPATPSVGAAPLPGAGPTPTLTTPSPLPSASPSALPRPSGSAVPCVVAP